LSLLFDIFSLVGICDDGYGGAPTRTCLDQGGSGVLSPLEYECIKSSFCLSLYNQVL